MQSIKMAQAKSTNPVMASASARSFPGLGLMCQKRAGQPCPEAMSSQSHMPSLVISCNSDSDTRKNFPPLRQSHMLNVINVQCQLCVCVGSHLCAHGCVKGECRCWSEHICLHELSVEMTGI